MLLSKAQRKPIMPVSYIKRVIGKGGRDMRYDPIYMISEFGMRSLLNLELLRSISNVYADSRTELQTLNAISENNSVLSDVVKVLNNNKKDKDEVVRISTIKKLFSLHAKHEKRAQRDYEEMNHRLAAKNLGELIIPGDLYFDGTQLINSLYGLVVLSSERFGNSRTGRREHKLAEFGGQNYCNIYNKIQELKQSEWDKEGKFYCDYRTKSGQDHFDGRADVLYFLKHLRNAMSHSGKGRIQFFPLTDTPGGMQITGIAFIDIDDRTQEIFYAKLSIEEILDIAKNLIYIFAKAEREEPARLTHKEIINRIDSLSGIG